MSKIKFPYSQLEMIIALCGLRNDNISDEKLIFFSQEIEKLMPEKKSDCNKKIAESNGIEVIDLINSPNYEILRDEYHAEVMTKLVEKMKDDFKFSDKQAWGIAASSMGLLD